MIARVIASRIARFFQSDLIQQRLSFLEAKEKQLARSRNVVSRTPHYCSGCPHNTSTPVPEGSMAFAAGTPLTVLDRSLGLPIRSELLQNHPNPFNPTTTIPFAVSTPSDVLLIVYSPLGQEVKTLVFEAMEPGYHRVTWDGRDNLGRSVASGIYLYRLVVGDFVDVKKALLVK